VTATLSEAVPPKATVAEVAVYVVAFVGVAIAAVGGVASPVGAVITHVNVCEAVNPPLSVARAATEYVPAVVPAPEMNPVLAISVNPGGSPVALYVKGCDAGSEPTSCSVTACPTADVRLPGFARVGGALL
jgi:hypothetical protein